jgi:hypothetical protein
MASFVHNLILKFSKSTGTNTSPTSLTETSTHRAQSKAASDSSEHGNGWSALKEAVKTVEVTLPDSLVFVKRALVDVLALMNRVKVPYFTD